MADSDRKGAKGADVEQCDRRDLRSDARAPESPPSTATNTEQADDRKSRPRVLPGKVRKGKRTQRRRGDPAMIELRGNRKVPGTVVDESSSGIAIEVADNSDFHPGQRVFVHRHGVRTAAIVRYVQGQPDGWRVGLKMQPV